MTHMIGMTGDQFRWEGSDRPALKLDFSDSTARNTLITAINMKIFSSA